LKTILAVAGTRPEIIKMAPVIKALRRRKGVRTLFVLSGQHYDYEMSTVFIKDLELPQPDEVLDTGSARDPVQLSILIRELSDFIARHRVDLVVAQGDTNTVVAAALAATKSGVPFAHVEAGLRNFDRRMPEELNRMIAADLAEINFAPTVRSAENLVNEGVPPSRICIVGNTIVDAVLEFKELAAKKSSIIEKLGLKKGEFVLATVHRVETVDNEKNLQSVVGALTEIAERTPVVIPLHPRTRKNLQRFGLDGLLRDPHIRMTEPLGYLDFLMLLAHCRFVMTDSGGVQEEALTLGVPCLTLRRSTERPETVEAGGNFVVGIEKGQISAQVLKLLVGRSTAKAKNPLGDGRAGERIAKVCLERLRRGKWFESPDYLESGAPRHRAIVVKEEEAGVEVSELERKRGGRVMAVYDETGSFVMPKKGLKLAVGYVAIVMN
jgi:UDP-N-acetylglucosamine 2-epimerase (non-hydrolysing)